MRHTAVRCAVVSLSAFCSLLSAAVKADVVYASAAFGAFGTIDLSTGVFTSIGTTHLGMTTDTLEALSFAPDGTLYGIGFFGELYKVNTTTAALTDLGKPTSFFSLNSLAVRSDGKLFGDNPFGDLFTIDPNTANATLVGNSGVFGSYPTGDLAFGANDTLYNISSFFMTNLYTRDQSTGAATKVGAQSLGISFPGGLVYDGGKLYAFDFFNNIYTIDPATGGSASTGVSVTGEFFSITAAAAAPLTSSVPEPGSLTLLAGLAATGAGLLARRKRRAR